MMKNRNLIIIISVLVIIVAGAIIIRKPFPSKRPAGKAATLKSEKAPVKIPAKKAFTKDKGGLRVKIAGLKNKETYLRLRAFKVVDSKYSSYEASFMSNKVQELPAGYYDIEVDVIPQKIYKNIRVTKGRETIEDLGCITGSLDITALNAMKKKARYPVKIFYSGSTITVVTTITNRPVELSPGSYDIEVNTVPPEIRKNIKVINSKETILDIGCVSGTLTVKIVDENGQPVQSGIRVKKSENNEFVSLVPANRPIEILQGTYNIEIAIAPSQSKKDVKIKAGEETVIECLVQGPSSKVPVKAPKQR